MPALHDSVAGESLTHPISPSTKPALYQLARESHSKKSVLKSFRHILNYILNSFQKWQKLKSFCKRICMIAEKSQFIFREYLADPLALPGAALQTVLQFIN